MLQRYSRRVDNQLLNESEKWSKNVMSEGPKWKKIVNENDKGKLKTMLLGTVRLI